MGVIPGKYVDGQGNELTVIGVADHGVSGEKFVIYRTDKGGMCVISEKDWEAEFTYGAELELREYLVGESRAELAKRITDLFESRDGVYNVRWRSVIGAEGYNYACENQGVVCRKGVDSCKNCRSFRPEPFSEAAELRHLSGEITIGVYPVAPDGGCRVLVMDPENRTQADALRDVCREYELPCYCELIGKRPRLWIFFAERIKIGYIRRLGNAIITLAMERSPEIGFDMYDRFLPCRDEILPEDRGFQLTLPFGKSGRDTGVFVVEDWRPLPHGAAEIFRVRTVTKNYLADRLNLLGAVGFGKLWSPSVREQLLPEDIARLDITFDGTLAIKKDGLTHKAILLFRRMACIKNPETPFGEFETLTPCVNATFTEDGEYIRLPRGLRADIEYMARASGCEMAIQNAVQEREKVHFSLCHPIGEEQLKAAQSLVEKGEGLLVARQGWGKTAAAAKLIEIKRSRTLILVADENTRLRWIGNIMAYFGIDTERSGSKIHVRTVNDRRVKDKYGLVILADCSRLPMDGEIFERIRGLTPSWIYGITASDHRRDGKWGLIHMLCGSTVFEA